MHCISQTGSTKAHTVQNNAVPVCSVWKEKVVNLGTSLGGLDFFVQVLVFFFCSATDELKKKLQQSAGTVTQVKRQLASCCSQSSLTLTHTHGCQQVIGHCLFKWGVQYLQTVSAVFNGEKVKKNKEHKLKKERFNFLMKTHSLLPTCVNGPPSSLTGCLVGH